MVGEEQLNLGSTREEEGQWHGSDDGNIFRQVLVVRAVLRGVDYDYHCLSVLFRWLADPWWWSADWHCSSWCACDYSRSYFGGSRQLTRESTLRARQFISIIADSVRMRLIEYGSLLSSLTTGLYLTFKLTSVVEKVQSWFTALKVLSRKDIPTLEQVNAAGNLCTICQEKQDATILLRCKHIFYENCISEWFERERTCPLCRTLVRPADLRSFGDGSTSLFF